MLAQASIRSASKSSGDCFELGRVSLQCIEEHNYNRQAPECVKHFDAYKQCKREMVEEKRRERAGAQKGFFS